MKRFICRRNPKYHQAAAIRIIGEILNYVPDNKKIMALIQQDIKSLMRFGPGVYYVTDKRPLGVKVLSSNVCHYFYWYQIINSKKRIQTFLIPRQSRFIK